MNKWQSLLIFGVGFLMITAGLYFVWTKSADESKTSVSASVAYIESAQLQELDTDSYDLDAMDWTVVSAGTEAAGDVHIQILANGNEKETAQFVQPFLDVINAETSSPVSLYVYPNQNALSDHQPSYYFDGETLSSVR